MAEEEKRFDEFMDKEDEVLSITLATSASRTALTIDEYIKVRQLEGASLDAIERDLLTDLNDRGRIFGEFRNSVKASVFGSINRLRDDAMFSKLGINETLYRWVAILVNTCPDCMDRHGISAEFNVWEADGLPRTGHTVCKQHCKCALIPTNTTDLEKLPPVMRGKK